MEGQEGLRKNMERRGEERREEERRGEERKVPCLCSQICNISQTSRLERAPHTPVDVVLAGMGRWSQLSRGV